MKFVQYQTENGAAPALLTADGSRIIPLERFPLSRRYESLLDLCRFGVPEDLALLKACDPLPEGIAICRAALSSPFPRPLHDILCVGVNYMAHRDEARRALDEAASSAPRTVYFSKRACATVGPDQLIESHAELDDCLDYEAELAVVIGKTWRDISKENAEEYIFGYTIMNDISARTLQKQHSQWLRGKSLDGFTVFGPCVVTADEIAYPPKLQVTSRVNGELRQSSNTDLLVADIGRLIAELSAGMTLEAGDIIATGTPAGVGMGFSPPRFMKRGDTVECEIEGIGILKNIIK